ncbi:hypothetical protein [uncultured Amphritea sp.]|uniref:hypothetical protein n=1 Tax=uncultured Amphritea sp. TaxID=981605 RepID=UPI00260A6799|nr:hypothetical protein [uncultured Amphritea sp.]
MKKVFLCVALAITAALSMPALADIDYSPPTGGFTGVVAYQASDSDTVPAGKMALYSHPSVMVAANSPNSFGESYRTKVTSNRPNNDGIGETGNTLAAAYSSFEVGWRS